ncbi:MAG: hypothetical protein HY298_02595 [Verrucomicrobia bacterium]|nr:hypothetical protein [Verrucomicrobiota bacterium]
MGKFILGFVLGAVIASIVTAVFLTRQFVDSERLIQQGDLAKEITEAFDAYKNQDALIAKWELNRLLPSLHKAAELEIEDNDRISFYLLLTHGRLSKLYFSQNDDENASRHAALAISAGNSVSLIHTGATTIQLYEVLEKFDTQGSSEMKIPKGETR